VRNHWHVSVKRDGVGYFPSRDGINLDLSKGLYYPVTMGISRHDPKWATGINTHVGIDWLEI
jgi:hypothetical protein